jgi:methionine synthase II (cobalamin-independent)
MEKVCAKVSYSEEKYANLDIKRFSLTNRKVKPTRTYLCVKCNTWHLTSLPINSNVVKKYYNKILVINSKNKALEKQIESLKIEIKKLSNNKAQIDLIVSKKECEKYKQIYTEYRNKYIKKVDSFSELKSKLDKIIKNLEENNVM